MRAILAIADQPEHDHQLVAELSAYRPAHVAILLPSHESDRLAELVTRAEWVTGAAAVGLVAHPASIDPSGYDAVVTAGEPSHFGARLRRRLGGPPKPRGRFRRQTPAPA